MTPLRTTAILKTDLSASTVRFRGLSEAELHALLGEHREFVRRHAADQDGRIVKPEGDGFWLVFPSVTAAATAAIAMQEELRLAQPTKGDDRLAMRIVIALGDVLHEEGALIGETVVLTARIEAITPPDEIYLSAAAWLAMNRAEIPTTFVDSVSLKGFAEPVAIYRVQQTHRTRVIANEYIVLTDLRQFSHIIESAPMATVEKMLETFFALANRVTRELGGTVRFSMGDAYCLTFPGASRAMAAAEHLGESWEAFVRREGLPCAMNVAVHHGTLYAFAGPEGSTLFRTPGPWQPKTPLGRPGRSGRVFARIPASVPARARHDIVARGRSRLGPPEGRRRRRSWRDACRTAWR